MTEPHPDDEQRPEDDGPDGSPAAPDAASFELPAALVADLRALDGGGEDAGVPAEIDAVVRLAARRHLKAAAGAGPASPGDARALSLRAGPPWRRWLMQAAAVLVITLGVWVVFTPSIEPQDINRDGTVDIRDAFELARRIKAGEVRRDHDLDGDHFIDDRDVELIGRLCVNLDRYPRDPS